MTEEARDKGGKRQGERDTWGGRDTRVGDRETDQEAEGGTQRQRKGQGRRKREQNQKGRREVGTGQRRAKEGDSDRQARETARKQVPIEGGRGRSFTV